MSCSVNVSGPWVCGLNTNANCYIMNERFTLGIKISSWPPLFFYIIILFQEPQPLQHGGFSTQHFSAKAPLNVHVKGKKINFITEWRARTRASEWWRLDNVDVEILAYLSVLSPRVNKQTRASGRWAWWINHWAWVPPNSSTSYINLLPITSTSSSSLDLMHTLLSAAVVELWVPASRN